ncbi:MAG: hypothetical protein EA425_17140 [Puniceicoccaceae bacterium]|nr:MAG: hypothetical protein EA425_17140 [Puniceicoccaceae bacterium]
MPISSLARLHLLNALFGHLTGDDLFLARQIEDAVEAALPPEPGLEQWMTAVVELAGRLPVPATDAGFSWLQVDPEMTALGTLGLRRPFLTTLGRLAGRRRGTLLVTGLHQHFSPGRGRSGKRRQNPAEDAAGYLRGLAAARCPAGLALTLLIT